MSRYLRGIVKNCYKRTNWSVHLKVNQGKAFCIFPARGGDSGDKKFSAGSIDMHRMVDTIEQVKLKS
ncbi:hypothetical protein AMJ44_07790 [candidate division WOR-1 bacterium DG_54_3]|uniref:Uncharacterized protein n=1 Tax=candidate division WOR-1 bacterium DG_54_3 TaxID=1703775 RepID=A0A0S7XWG0_UNCSA|nr:MAG: hypothetical protein AMJ44_07790 [candidate division WOR-1 bacterium DG_54_3]